MKFLLCFLVACESAGPEKGFLFDERSKKWANDLNTLIELQAQEFKRPNWASELAKTPINIVTFDRLVPCGGITALGCTVDYTSVIIVRTIDAPSIVDTALPHELIHVYSCIINNDCDFNHSNIAMWEAGERAYARLQESLK